jgi:hypothetical protein
MPPTAFGTKPYLPISRTHWSLIINKAAALATVINPAEFCEDTSLF